MSKRIIGITCGRKNGNSENFLKSALMGAEESGIKSDIIRVMDMRVLPCTGCWACMKTEKCAKDDVDWILENSMLADSDTAVIVSAPVYHIRSNAYMMIITEKINHLFPGKQGVSQKKKVGAAISVGGSGYDGWTSLGLPSINIFLQHFTTLVDQVQINHCADKGAALTPDNEGAIERCKQLGRNVAGAMNIPIEQVRYMGEDTPVSCPVCHCNVMYFEKDFPEIACPICQVHGKVSIEGNKYKIDWAADDIRNPRFSPVRRVHHREFLENHRKEEWPQIEMPETQEKIKAYNAYGHFIKPAKKS